MRTPRMRPAITDLVLASILGLWAQWMVWTDQVPGPVGPTAVLFMLVGWPLVVRRSHPLVPVVALAIAGSVQAAATGNAAEGGFLVAANLVGVYSVAAWGTKAQAWLGLGITVVAVTVSGIFDPQMRTAEQVWAGAFFALLAGATWIAGRWANSRRTTLTERALAEAALARQREIVTAERARIARELHDVVAHEVSVMVVQAVGALGVLGTDPERAREPLMRIESSGREALDELRQLLGVMREETETLDARMPQPGLADLPALLAGVTDTGVRVDLHVDGDPRPVPRAIELSIYRIVQEALTNTIKHSGASTAQVQLSYAPDALAIDVADDGRGAPTTTSGGHGLVGMRERVALHGGELRTETPINGGFRVHACIPCATEIV